MFTLTQAKEAIKNKPEFSCTEKDGYTVIDYNVTFPDTFNGDPILLNLRGTCFDNTTGKITRLMYHKFFNFGEPNAMFFDLSEPHSIQLKLDGSLIAPIVIPGGTKLEPNFIWGTRAGATDVSAMVEDWLEVSGNRVKYENLARTMIVLGFTPIFEFTSRMNKVVIDYKEPNLTLTDIRNNLNGSYLMPMLVKAIAGTDIPFVEVFDSADNMTALVKMVRGWTDKEGIVVKSSTGNFVKIKADQYVLLHKTKDEIKFEKNVLKLIFTSAIDDLKPLLDANDSERVSKYEEYVLNNVFEFHVNLFNQFNQLKEQAGDDRKLFAELVKNNRDKSFLFTLFTTGKVNLNDYILKHCGSSTDVEKIRNIIGEKQFMEF